jgi:hypothetical protein
MDKSIITFVLLLLMTTTAVAKDIVGYIEGDQNSIWKLGVNKDEANLDEFTYNGVDVPLLCIISKNAKYKIPSCVDNGMDIYLSNVRTIKFAGEDISATVQLWCDEHIQQIDVMIPTFIHSFEFLKEYFTEQYGDPAPEGAMEMDNIYHHLIWSDDNGDVMQLIYCDLAVEGEPEKTMRVTFIRYSQYGKTP